MQQFAKFTPLVSIGVASFNNGHYIRYTLDSIRDQDYSNCEIIIVDDSSKDNSVDVIEQWIMENPTTMAKLIINEQNCGIPTVFNKALAASRGKYFSIIGSDDIYVPHKIAMQVAVMQHLDDGYGMCYSDIIRIDEHGQVRDNGAIVTWGQGMPEGNVLKPLIVGNFIPAMSVLIRTDVLKRVGAFDETLSFEDWNTWLCIAEKYSIKYVPGVVAHYRVHGNSAMSTQKRILTEDSVKVIKRYRSFKELEEVVEDKLSQLACNLYIVGSPSATNLLWQTVWKRPSIISFAYLILSAVGIKYQIIVNIYKYLRVK